MYWRASRIPSPGRACSSPTTRPRPPADEIFVSKGEVTQHGTDDIRPAPHAYADLAGANLVRARLGGWSRPAHRRCTSPTTTFPAASSHHPPCR